MSNSNEMKELVNKINNKIQEYKLQNILLIIGVFFTGIITYSIVVPEKGYDCSGKGEVVVDKIMQCEQMIVNERIKEKELELEKYKVSQNYKLESLKLTLQKMDFKNPQQVLKQLEASAKSLELIALKKSCQEQVMEAMCPMVSR